MPLPLILTALIALQDPQTAVPPTAQTPAVPALLKPDFQAAPGVAEPVRLALTPKLDGVIQPEEWDEFASSSTAKTYLQWEPGKLHVAGTVPDGNDLLVALDLKGNGWLVGKDNVEIRIGMRGGAPVVTARMLDATRVDGPRWIDLPGIALASLVVAKSDGGSTTYEASLGDGDSGLFPSDGAKVAARIDGVGNDVPPAEPFLPRVLAPVTFSMSRAAALPNGLRWDVDGQGSYATAGEGIKVRFKFVGNEKLSLQRFSMRTEGLARTATSDGSVPFPPLDGKGRAFVDYTTMIAKDAEPGYRIVQGSLVGEDGIPGIVEASYRIAPWMEVSMPTEPIRSKAVPQTVRLVYYVQSNSFDSRRTDGSVKVRVPQGFRLMDGDDRDFSIFGARGKVRRVFNLEVPSSVTGVFPIVFHLESRGKTIEYTGYLRVE